MALTLALGGLQERLYEPFAGARYLRNAEVNVGVTYHLMGRFEAPGTLAPVRTGWIGVD